MKDLKYYKEIFCSSELELYFMEENGSCSFSPKKEPLSILMVNIHLGINSFLLTKMYYMD